MLTTYKFPLKAVASNDWYPYMIKDYDNTTVAELWDGDTATKIAAFLNAYQKGEIECP